MHHPHASQDLLARLYLCAVLPAAAELVAHDEAARQAAGQAPWRVRLSSPSGYGTTLIYDGRDLSASSRTQRGELRLMFVGSPHVVSTFQARTTFPPLPIWGHWHLHRARNFNQVCQRLSVVLAEPSPAPLLRTRLLFGGLLARGLVELVQTQRECSGQLHRFGDFLVAMQVSDQVSSWFGYRQGEFSAGTGEPPYRADTTIRFRDIPVAAAAAAGTLDQLAAVGVGDIEVRGRLGLADLIDVLLNRIGVYLQ